ncbi:MAG: hypothetical protein P4L31_02385 [Candidatus Babeliales bacterium]|nr:hypothetical protein [Candidatus Babeliales bacterium]
MKFITKVSIGIIIACALPLNLQGMLNRTRSQAAQAASKYIAQKSYAQAGRLAPMARPTRITLMPPSASMHTGIPRASNNPVERYRQQLKSSKIDFESPYSDYSTIISLIEDTIANIKTTSVDDLNFLSHQLDKYISQIVHTIPPSQQYEQLDKARSNLRRVIHENFPLNINTLVELHKDPKKWSSLKEPYHAYTSDGPYGHIDTFFMQEKTPQHINDITVENLNYVYHRALGIYENDTRREPIYDAANKKYGIADIDGLSIKELISLFYLFYGTENQQKKVISTPSKPFFLYGMRKGNLITTEEDMKKGLVYNKPEWAIAIENQIVETAITLFDQLSIDDLKLVDSFLSNFNYKKYYRLFPDYLKKLEDVDSNHYKLKKLLQKKFGTHDFFENLGDIPYSRFTNFIKKPSSESALTHHHAYIHIDSIRNNIFNHIKFHNRHLKNMFRSTLEKQQEETAKNNYMFVHGRQAEWQYLADIYKGVYNLTKPMDKQVGDDFTFLRFDDSKRKGMFNDDPDALFMNASLFGNSCKKGSCTATFVMEGSDWSGGPSKYGFSVQSFFTTFKLKSYYLKYEKDFQELEKLFHQANPENFGQLLGISIPLKDIDRVKTLYSETNIKKSIESGHIDDKAEYILDVDKDYLLDPYNGPRIYSFNATDPKKFAAYQAARTQLFAKIRKDKEPLESKNEWMQKGLTAYQYINLLKNKLK